MVAATEHHPSESVTAAVWTGFAMMCIGMFMAILDVQVVATSLATIQQALDIAQDQMSWIQTAYLIAEIIYPAHRISDPLADDAVAFCCCRVGVHACVNRLRRKYELFVSHHFSRLAGIFRRHADPARFFGRFLAFSGPASDARDHDRRRAGRSRPDRRAGGRRLDHRDVFMALAFPDQCFAWRGCCPGSVGNAAERTDIL
jgi:hypothetical protein